MKLTVKGTVQGVEHRRRWLFFKESFLMVRMNPDDIGKVEREVNARTPGYGSLGSKGCAVPFSMLGDPGVFRPGQRVEMTAAIGGAMDQFFFGTPPLSLDSIRPLPAGR